MVNQKELFEALNAMGVDFFTGVPDSLLNDFCLYMTNNMTAEQHDDMIAFTSQLTHIAANAFVKDEANYPAGFPVGGSFRDFTRVADLNENMWSDLFLENKEYILNVLGNYIDELEKYRKAITDEDEETLKELLKAGSQSKKTADLKYPVLTMEL